MLRTAAGSISSGLALGIVLASVLPALAADPTLVIRTSRDGPCGPAQAPLGVGSDGRIWVVGWCSGIYALALGPDGETEIEARRQMGPSQAYADYADQVLPRSDGRAWIVGEAAADSPYRCALMLATQQGVVEVVQSDAGCLGASVAVDAIVTVRQLENRRVRTEKFLADGTRAWTRDSAVAAGASVRLVAAADGTVHVTSTTYDTAGFEVLSYRADGTPLRPLQVNLADDSDAFQLAVDAAGTLFATVTVYEADIGFREDLIRIEPGVGVAARVTLPTERGYVEALHAIDSRAIVVMTARDAANLPQSISVSAYAADFTPDWSRVFEEPSDWRSTASKVDARGNLALAMNSRPPATAPRFVVLDQEGRIVSDARPPLPPKSNVRALSWLGDGDLAVAAAGTSAANAYGTVDDIVLARVAPAGSLRWVRAEGTLTQQTEVVGAYPDGNGNIGVVTATMKPQPPPSQPLDPIYKAFRVDVFDAQGNTTFTRELPEVTGGVAWLSVASDGRFVTVTNDEGYVSRARIARYGATPATDWEHVIEGAGFGVTTRLSGGEIAYSMATSQSGTLFGALTPDGQLLFEAPMAPAIPGRALFLAQGSAGTVDVYGSVWPPLPSSPFCGSFDLSGVQGALAFPTVGDASLLAPGPGSSVSYSRIGPAPNNSARFGRVACGGATLWEVQLPAAGAGWVRAARADPTGGIWIVDFRPLPARVVARHYDESGTLLGSPVAHDLPFAVYWLVAGTNGSLAVAGAVRGTDACDTPGLASFGPNGNLAWTWLHVRAPEACESATAAPVPDGNDWWFGTELRLPGQPAAAQVIRVTERLFSNGFE